MTCSLLECKKVVNADTGRVEVRAYQVSSSNRTGLKVLVILLAINSQWPYWNNQLLLKLIGIGYFLN